jgi:hypothetical protein
VRGERENKDEEWTSIPLWFSEADWPFPPSVVLVWCRYKVSPCSEEEKHFVLIVSPFLDLMVGNSQWSHRSTLNINKMTASVGCPAKLDQSWNRSTSCNTRLDIDSESLSLLLHKQEIGMKWIFCIGDPYLWPRVAWEKRFQSRTSISVLLNNFKCPTNWI